MEKNYIILQRIQTGNTYFSLLSLLLSLFLMFLILINKQLRSSLTYTFLMFIFISEIVNSVGNMIQSLSSKQCNQFLILVLISFSDIFTNLLFLFFSYCSITLIKETNRLIKNKVKFYIIISLIVSFLYSIILLIIGLINKTDKSYIDVRFKNYYSKNDKNDIKSSKYYYFSLIHTIFIMLISCFTIHYFYNLLIFMNEKLKNDKVNSRNIAILMKILFRYPLIILLLLIFFIIRIGFVTFSDENNKLRDISYLLSESLFCLRGTLIFLSTIKSSKLQDIITRFIEVNIKHYLLLNYVQLSNKHSIENKVNTEEEMEKE